ncbi:MULTISPECIES: MFS transporter [Actinosynnema]|uniref:MFS transporter n=1 Tax=Actinosynnema TaxID=40566 RepID=UPI0020A30CDA|nr:MFS transporter [Actinosynnema pretiosum]MCP2097176.1 putative arabinose efflux permease, MFS family [Actinosynnema pretiosum]
MFHVMRLYLLCAGSARLADEMVAVTLVLLALERTGSSTLSGLVVAAYTIPSVVSGPLLGAWLDRTTHPVAALAGNQFALAASTLGMALLPGTPALTALAFLAGLALPLTSGGFTSLIPRLTTDLSRSTSNDALLFNAAAIAGPALAGVLAATSGPVTAVLVITALALAGGLCTLCLRVPPHPPAAHPPLLVALRQGVRHLAVTPPLRGTTIASVLGYGAVGLLATALPARLTELDGTPARLGLLLAVLELGCVVGLLVLRGWLNRRRPEHVMLTALLLYGAALATWPLATTTWALMALVALTGLVDAPILPATINARQRYTPPTLLGQLSTTGASLKIGAYALGAAAGGTLLSSFPPSGVIWLAAAGQVLAATVGAAATTNRKPLRVTP